MKTVSYRTYSKALEKLQNDTGDRRITVYNAGFSGEAIKLEINWSSATVPASEAREFACHLIETAALVEKFEYNGYTVAYDEN